jgi:hypothetical protein
MPLPLLPGFLPFDSCTLATPCLGREPKARVATKFVSIHTLLSLGVALDFEIHQMGIKYAFLNGDLDKSIYMTQLDGFEVVDHKYLVPCIQT